MEHAMAGGNVAAEVVRVGGTVRKPAGYWTPGVEALLAHLEAGGFTGAPRPLGRDDQGRQVLEYVPGPMAMDAPPLDDAGLRRVGRLIRDLHDASAGFEPPPGAHWNVAIPPDRADLICHHDLAPWNLVLGADRWVFIDWDGAGPGSRLWDLAGGLAAFFWCFHDHEGSAVCRDCKSFVIMKCLVMTPRSDVTSDSAGSFSPHSGHLPVRSLYRVDLPPILRGVLRGKSTR